MNFPSKKISDGVFEGVELSEPSAYQDHRGYYYTIYDDDNRSCVHGEVYCVIVDNRKDSDTFIEWAWDILSLHNRKVLVLPPGVGLSYLVLSDSANIFYKWSYPGGYPDIDEQFSLKWNDSDLQIFWPIKEPILQPRDV